MTNKNNCAGTYRVSGYKRQDGTKVSSYMRTCGVKHEGLVKKSILTNIQGSLVSNSLLEHLQEYIVKNTNFPFIFSEYYKIALDFDKAKKIIKIIII